MTTKLSDIVALQDLRPDSFVVDVGAYEGAYIDEVLKRGVQTVIAYEPVFYYELAEKYARDTRVHVSSEALGKENGVQKIYARGEGSSFFKEWANSSDVRYVPVKKASVELGNCDADILKLNCEGAEYDILHDLFSAGLLGNFMEILVQFHKTPGADRGKCEEMLLKTHEQVYNQKWSLWRKKHG